MEKYEGIWINGMSPECNDYGYCLKFNMKFTWTVIIEMWSNRVMSTQWQKCRLMLLCLGCSNREVNRDLWYLQPLIPLLLTCIKRKKRNITTFWRISRFSVFWNVAGEGGGGDEGKTTSSTKTISRQENKILTVGASIKYFVGTIKFRYRYNYTKWSDKIINVPSKVVVHVCVCVCVWCPLSMATMKVWLLSFHLPKDNHCLVFMGTNG